MAEEAASPPDPIAVMRSRRFVGFLVVAGLVGIVASLAAWCFLELIHLAQVGVYDKLPRQLGFDHTPMWWSLPVLALAGLVVAFAIARLPGKGGHVAAYGLNPSPTEPIDLPGVMLAAVAGIGLGIVLGPEAPLIALGGAIGLFSIRRLRGDAPPELATLAGACGTFAAVSFLFGSPIIAAVILIEATALGGPRQQLVLIPGLLAAGIGTLVSTGMGSWTGVNQSDISLSLLSLPHYARPDLTDFLWTIPLAVVIAVVVAGIFRLARATVPVASSRPFAALPVIGVIVGALAMAFVALTDKGADSVLFSGQDALTPLVDHAGTWSEGALLALLAFKSIGYGLSLGSFRGGPAFPAIFLGAAAGILLSQLTGFAITAAVGVGIGAGVVAVLRLPLSAVTLSILLISRSGLGAGPLIILGVVVAYMTVLALDARRPESASAPAPAPAPSG